MELTNYVGLGGIALGSASLTLIIMIAWMLFWKGFALWYAAERRERWWFVAFLLINTFGVLEIAYIFFIAKVPLFRERFGLESQTEEPKEEESQEEDDSVSPEGVKS